MSESALMIRKLLVVGLIAGVVGGGLGVGGGIIIVPLLVAIGLDRHRSHATSLAGIVLIATAGAVSFGLSGEINVGVGVTVGIGGVVGSVIGASIMHRTSPKGLTIVFGLVLMAAAFRMISGANPLPGSADYATATLVMLGLAIGLIAGFFAGLAGVGGGVVIVPSAVLLLGLSQHEAQGTSLVAIIFTAVAGTIINIRNKRVRLEDGLAVGVGGVIGAVIGAQIALLVEGRTLSLLFGFLVLFVAVRTLYRVVRPQQSTV